MKRKVWLGITLACSFLFTGGVLLSTSGGIDTQGNGYLVQNDPPTPWSPSSAYALQNDPPAPWGIANPHPHQDQKQHGNGIG